MTAALYHQAARAEGAWAVRLTLDPVAPVRTANTLLEHLAAASVPLTGYVTGHGELLLARDPSVTHGTPSVQTCVRAVAGLREWRARPVQGGLLAVFGLRVGYDRDAPVHRATDLAALLEPPFEVEERWLVSARRMPGTGLIRWWREPCAVVTAPGQPLARLDQAAAALGQHRYTITDWTRGHTTARARTTGGAR